MRYSSRSLTGDGRRGERPTIWSVPLGHVSSVPLGWRRDGPPREAGDRRARSIGRIRLHWLLAVIAGGQPRTAWDADALVANLDAARTSLLDALANVDILRRRLALAADLVAEP